MMAAIRPLERSDLPAVASLYERIQRSGSPTPAPGLVSYFERTFLDHPWVDLEIPSLVYVDDEGAIGGFIGSSVRRLVFDGKPIRMGVSGPLFTNPNARSHAAGAFLMKKYLSGPQEVTITDGANDVARRLWERLGGEASQLGCVGWLRVFRPLSLGSELLGRKRARAARALSPLAHVLDRATTSLVPGRVGVRPPNGRTSELTARDLVEYMREAGGTYRLRPDYDVEFADWLFHELECVRSRGTLVRRLVHDERDDVTGWFVYYARSAGTSFVLQIVAVDDDQTGHVIDHLLNDARARGSNVLRGRLEAPLREPLSLRNCVFRRSDAFALIHSSSTEILHVIQSGKALLTRLEGEWWMGHHVEELSTTQVPPHERS